MANYAYVTNNEITGVYDLLPVTWGNISNFHVLDAESLKALGWYAIEKVMPSYDPTTQKLDHATQYISNGSVYETQQVIDLPVEPPAPILTADEQAALEQQRISDQWTVIRTQRDQIVSSFDWRVARYNREVRLGLTPVDDIHAIDQYMQALADIPEKQTDPFNIVWPEFGA